MVLGPEHTVTLPLPLSTRMDSYVPTFPLKSLNTERSGLSKVIGIMRVKGGGGGILS